MDFEVLPIITALSIPVAAIVAFIMNSSLTSSGDAKPFRWGFYNAGMAAGVAVGYTLEFLVYVNDSYPEGIDYLVAALVVGAYSFAALLLFQRKRAGAVIMTILALNPVSWIINYAYFKNRWNELLPMNETQIPPRIQSTVQQYANLASSTPAKKDPVITFGNENAKTKLCPPESHRGRWTNEHYTVILLPERVEVLEHGSGSMRFPAIVEESMESNAYIISYADPYTLARIAFRFSLESVSKLTFMLDRDGYNIEVRETLEKVG